MKKTATPLFLLLLFVMQNVQAQVPSYVPTNGLLAWYGFNSSPNDDSGNNNHAVNNGATYYNDRFGNVGAAGYFNGSNAYMVVQTPSFTLSESGNFTYSFWIRKEVQPAAGIVMMTGVNTPGVFITLVQGPSQTTFGTNIQQSAWAFINAPHTLNVWDHYVATYDAGAMKLYKNGNLESSGTYPYNGATAMNVPLYIGKGIGSGNFLGGIDDMGIWNRTLSDQEIIDLHNNSITGLNAVAGNGSTGMLYPNPVQEALRLPAEEMEAADTYRVINAMGQIMQEGQLERGQNNLSLTDMPEGVYVLQTDKGKSYRFVKGR